VKLRFSSELASRKLLLVSQLSSVECVQSSVGEGSEVYNREEAEGVDLRETAKKLVKMLL